mmetsp:Transcript_4088/g.11154  ORF Transcript_4088/g.11154 Transcript_4088/m.11154 type:complete len:209 (-) Transcript_4088:357-983(-)
MEPRPLIRDENAFHNAVGKGFLWNTGIGSIVVRRRVKELKRIGTLVEPIFFKELGKTFSLRQMSDRGGPMAFLFMCVLLAFESIVLSSQRFDIVGEGSRGRGTVVPNHLHNPKLRHKLGPLLQDWKWHFFAFFLVTNIFFPVVVHSQYRSEHSIAFGAGTILQLASKSFVCFLDRWRFLIVKTRWFLGGATDIILNVVLQSFLNGKIS